ncbi:MAG TPA: hypothetical protein VFV94_18170 [Polyangiaceae bacterium]|nr:hypothetical protein [Polyangiaceae bacterium]
MTTSSPAHFLLLVTVGCTALPHGPVDSRGGTAGEGGMTGTAGAPSHDATCSETNHIELPLDLFGAAVDPPSVRRFDDRFVLRASGSLNLSRSAELAVVSWQGLDIQNHLSLSGLCPDDVCTNVLGVSVLATPFSTPQLLLTDEGSVVSMPSYLVHAKAWDTSRSDPAVTPLFDAHIAAITTRAALQSSRDAARALFVLGNIDDPTLQVIEMGADAAIVAPVSTLTLPPLPWDCLTVVPTERAGAISAVVKGESGVEVTWQLRELDADATSTLETAATIPVGEALGYTDCPIVVDGPDGFHAQWVNGDGQSVVAGLTRAAGRNAAPRIATFEVSPGVLAGALGKELLFQGFVDAEHRGFSRFLADGSPGGAPIPLPVLPEPTPERRRALPTLLSSEGESLFVTYELEDERVIAELRCR